MIATILTHLTRSRLSLTGMGLSAGAAVLGAALLFNGGPAHGEEFLGDPTVGTLPILGDDDDVDFDQSFSLTGPGRDIRDLLREGAIFASGEGAVRMRDLPGGQLRATFYGDVLLRFHDLPRLEKVQVRIDSGLEGGGMIFGIESTGVLGTVHSLPAGNSLPLDLVRMDSAGLFETPLTLHAMHEIGHRTRVEMALESGVFTVRQDV